MNFIKEKMKFIKEKINNRLFIALVFCFLLGIIYCLTPVFTAAQPGLQQTNQVITQGPVDDGTSAKLVIEGPSKIKAGNLVVISVEKSRASTFKWVVIPSTDNYLVIDGGKRVVFSSGVSGEFKFIVACSVDDTCDVAVHTVTVLGQAATPIDTLQSKITFWCDKIESDTKRDDCLKLAQSFSSVALILETGNLTTPTQIVEATIKSNQDALGSKIEDWQPFRKGLSDELKKMSDTKKLTDAKSHIETWKAIAVSLREYASTL